LEVLAFSDFAVHGHACKLSLNGIGTQRMLKFPSATLLVSLLLGAGHATAQQSPDVLLSGVITHADNQTYKEVPFTVPEGVERLSVEFTYTGREQRTTIDLGIFDPVGFRGWSGGNKTTFTLAVTDATPSFLPGPIIPGRWFLVLGIPNIRENVQSQFTVKVYFGHRGDTTGPGAFTSSPLRTGLAWYRGDLHLHTGHSDGACRSQSGARVPCPVFKTVQAAAERGLDFIAITDHNTNSQFDPMRELQTYFDRLLLIPGREITTFHGHANVFGPVDFIDFRLGTEHLPNLAALQTEVEKLHGVLSVNHPTAPSGENCMGCGWTVADTDFRRIQAVEIVNAGGAEGENSGIPFWEALLNHGLRITAVGGSDNHDPDKPQSEPGGVGYPETVVHAQNLTQQAVLAAIRSGHVYLDLEGSTNRLLEYTASTERHKADMGDTLDAKRGESIHLSVHVANVAGGLLELIQDGQSLTSKEFIERTINDSDTNSFYDWISDGARHWLRVAVRTPTGKLVLIGNPIFVNY
jgi:hypothetical protein